MSSLENLNYMGLSLRVCLRVWRYAIVEWTTADGGCDSGQPTSRQGEQGKRRALSCPSVAVPSQQVGRSTRCLRRTRDRATPEVKMVAREHEGQALEAPTMEPSANGSGCTSKRVLGTTWMQLVGLSAAARCGKEGWRSSHTATQSRKWHSALAVCTGCPPAPQGILQKPQRTLAES